MRGGGEDVADHVLFLEVRADHAPAAPTLTTVGLDGQALHVAGPRHRDDHVLLGDEVKGVQLALVGLDTGAPRVGEAPLDLEELLLDQREDLGPVVQQRLQVLDPLEQLLVLVLELLAREPGEASKRHVQDVVGLDLGELEPPHQLGPGVLGVGRPPDDLDDLVEVVQGDEQPLDDVVALLRLAQPVARAAGDHVLLVADVLLHHRGQVEDPGLHPVNQRQHVHTERVLELGVLVELVQRDMGVGAVAELDDQAQALAVRLVADGLAAGTARSDLPDLPVAAELGDLGQQRSRVHLVRKLRDDDALAAARGLLDLGDPPHLHGPPPGLVGVPDALAPQDQTAQGEIRPLDVLHQLGHGDVGVVDGRDDPVDDLAQVVRGDVGGHPHGDPAGPVHQQVREPGREYDGLLLVPVVIRDEVHRLLVDVPEELHGDKRQTGFCVTHGRRFVAFGGAEVAVAVDEGCPQGEVLAHPDQGVVDGLVAVGVVLLHDLPHRRRALAVWPVRAEARLEHRPQDAALDRLQPVADVGQRAPHDDRHRVVQVRALDLVLDVDRLDAPREQRRRHLAGHRSPTRQGSARLWRSSG